MTVRIQDVTIGDTIKESRSGIEVKQLDFLSCSSRGVHVNGNLCYEWNWPVEIIAAVKHEEEGPCPRCGGDHAWCQSVQQDEFGGKTNVSPPCKDSPFSDKALHDRLRRQAREKLYA